MAVTMLQRRSLIPISRAESFGESRKGVIRVQGRVMEAEIPNTLSLQAWIAESRRTHSSSR